MRYHREISARKFLAHRNTGLARLPEKMHIVFRQRFSSTLGLIEAAHSTSMIV